MGNTEDKKIIKAPYNFVKFSSRHLCGNMQDHDSTDSNLKSGEINITITAQTPIIVGQKSSDEKEVEFYKMPNGEHAIPGSTIKGLVRENMNILGLGYIHVGENFEDDRLFYRCVAASGKGIYKDLFASYKEVIEEDIDGETVKKPIPGYITKEGNEYYIYGVKLNHSNPESGKSGKPYIRIKRNDQKLENVNGTGSYCKTIDCCYKKDEDNSVLLAKRDTKDFTKGTLLFTGKSVGRENPVYLFPPIDENSKIKVDKEDIRAYKIDFENRKNTLKPLEFWELPKEGEQPKAIFYLRHDNHIYIGRCLCMRVGYEHSLAEGLKKHLKDVNTQKDIDNPHAILGYSKLDAENKSETYKSRVSFGNMKLVEEPVKAAATKLVLSSGKPSFFPGYVEGGKNYNQDDFEVRGYKMYWMKEIQKEKIEAKDTVCPKINPLEKDSKFSGTIRYKNLTSEELGLLLWCLKLEEDCFQSIGMGKPYGYGCVEIKIDSIKELNLQKLYDLNDMTFEPFRQIDENQITEYIDKYKKYMCEQVNICIDDSADENEISINEFIKMKKTFVEKERADLVEYMSLNGYTEAKNQKGHLDKIADVIDKIDESRAEESRRREDPAGALKAAFADRSLSNCKK